MPLVARVRFGILKINLKKNLVEVRGQSQCLLDSRGHWLSGGLLNYMIVLVKISWELNKKEDEWRW